MVGCPLVFDIDRVIRQKLSPTSFIGFSCSDSRRLKVEIVKTAKMLNLS